MHINTYLNQLQEAKKATLTKVSKEAKIKRVQGALATKMAKDKNDPMYDKMIKFKKKWQNIKDKIQTKYASRVRSKARK